MTRTPSKLPQVTKPCDLLLTSFHTAYISRHPVSWKTLPPQRFGKHLLLSRFVLIFLPSVLFVIFVSAVLGGEKGPGSRDGLCKITYLSLIFVKGEKELVQMWPGLLAERQANAPAPVLVTTPRGQPNPRSPNPPRSSSNKQNPRGDGVPARELVHLDHHHQNPHQVHSTAPPCLACKCRIGVLLLKLHEAEEVRYNGLTAAKCGHMQPHLGDVFETTDIYRFPDTGMGPYRKIFVCIQCMGFRHQHSTFQDEARALGGWKPWGSNGNWRKPRCPACSRNGNGPVG